MAEDGDEAVIIVRCDPPRECSPNARVHWRRKARAVGVFRFEAAQGARYEATPGVRRFCGYDYPDQGGVRLDVDITWGRGRKRMDDDNARASLKPLIDGIADVLWFGRDEHVTIGQVTQRTSGDGMVRVTLARAHETGATEVAPEW